MKTKKACLLLFAILQYAAIFGQIIKGTVHDESTGERLPNANIVVKGTNLFSFTDINGVFILKDIGEKKISIEVRFIGYETKTVDMELNGKTVKKIDVGMVQSDNISDQVVVVATKTERKIKTVPARINLLSAKTLNTLPALNSDELLKYIPGVNVSRVGSFISHRSNVTMRGMSGCNQSRTLVLVDGIPVNKSDGGSVNWNSISTGNISRIEVSKGPGSSLYGSNAMGGVINIITNKPYKKLGVDARLGYGSLNTMNSNININGRLSDTYEKGMYWAINGLYNKSDGYINLVEEERDSTTIKSGMEEYAAGLLMAYNFNRNNNLELQLSYYNDRRGSGTKIFIPEGETMDHGTYKANLIYTGQISSFNIKASVFYQNENYIKFRERSRKGNYTCYSVDSKREDMGVLFHISKNIGEHNIVTTGFDIKQGSVNALDDYTETNKYIPGNEATDKVYNKGKMNTAAVFVQDEISLHNDKLKIVAGLRFDQAKFFDGAYYIENPTYRTVVLSDLENRNIDEGAWNSISPRLSGQYKFDNNFRTYISYAKGFRPSVLDDLCRSGFIRGGFKKANPNTQPETIHTFEIGSDISALKDKFNIAVSVYYSIGKDFQYYVNTGESMLMGKKMKPVRQNENISEIELYGGEIAADYNIMKDLSVFANYTYAHSTITNYHTAGNEIDISGKFLRYVPEHQYNIGVNWNNKLISTNILYHYKGKQYGDDLNDMIIEPTNTIDLKLQRNIYKKTSIALYINNLLNEVSVVDKDYLSMGRFVKGEIRMVF